MKNAPMTIWATIDKYGLPQQAWLGGDVKGLHEYVRLDLANALVEALCGAIGALEFSRDYHADLSNEDQSLAQDKLDAARAALAAWEDRKGGAA